MPDGNPGREERGRADQELDAFILKRHEERERLEGRTRANAEAMMMFSATAAREREEQEQRRLAWLDWHTNQARALESLAEEHWRAADELLFAEAGRGGTW